MRVAALLLSTLVSTLALTACETEPAQEEDAAADAAVEKPEAKDPEKPARPSAEERKAKMEERKKVLETKKTAPSDVAAPPADATKTDSGLAWKRLDGDGSGDKPSAWDIVSVEYTGWTTDGEMFDSSFKRSSAAKFPLNRVIPGWTEGLQLLGKGDTARFWIPVELAYNNMPGKPAGMLVFDVELLDIIPQEKPPEPPPVPDDVAAPPADAKKTSSGLAYKVLKSGGKSEHPSETSTVKVHYSGWTTDGKMFDSSVVRGQPASFPLNRVIAGWTEGLQLMSPGDSYRFWIPVELAYKNMPGKPPGMLVFDVELLEVKSSAAKTAPSAAKTAPACDSARLAECKREMEVTRKAMRKCMDVLRKDSEEKLSGRSSAKTEQEMRDCKANGPGYVERRNACKPAFTACGESVPGL